MTAVGNETASLCINADRFGLLLVGDYMRTKIIAIPSEYPLLTPQHLQLFVDGSWGGTIRETAEQNDHGGRRRNVGKERLILIYLPYAAHDREQT